MPNLMKPYLYEVHTRLHLTRVSDPDLVGLDDFVGYGYYRYFSKVFLKEEKNMSKTLASN